MSAEIQESALAEITHLSTSELSSYERNAQTHSDFQIERLCASIREFGFNQPVLIGEDRQIIAGHGRVLAAKKLGRKKVPCIIIGHLSPEKRRAYIIADNQMSRLAGIDEEILASELAELYNLEIDMGAIGYTESELLELLNREDLDSEDFDQSIPGPKKEPLPPNPMSSALMPYLGGKYRMAQQVIQHFPPHDTYVECFGGAGSVLLNKSPVRCEVYNDLNADLVNVFEILRDKPSELIRGLKRTAYAEDELRLAMEETDDKVERARRFLARAHMVFHPSQLFGDKSNFKIYSSGYGNAAKRLEDFVRRLPAFIRRVKQISITNMPAAKIMEKMDSPTTLHYVDPPYVGATRKSGGVYECEMLDISLHEELLSCILTLQGTVVLSGYGNELYDVMLSDWKRITIPVRVFNTSGGVSEAEEVLWINKPIS